MEPWAHHWSLYEMAQISEHFTAEERRCRCGQCDGAVTENAELVRMLEDARTRYGTSLQITSWCRCPAHNAAEGGKSDSAHLTGKAVDIRCNNGHDRWRLLHALEAAGFARIGVARTFLHADIDTTKPLPNLWTY